MTTTQITGRQVSFPHGTFYSLVTQAIADATAVQAIAFEEDDDVHGFTHSSTDNTKVFATIDGSYLITVSGIASLANLPADKHLEIWPAIDGTAVPDANTRVQIPSINTEITVAVCFILDLDAGHYFEMMTWGDDTDCQWLATAVGTSPDRPATPSVIMTCNLVNGY